MRKLLTLSFLLCLLSITQAQTYYYPSEIPDPKTFGDGFVSDPDDFLTSEEEDELNAIASEIRDRKGFEVAIVIVSSINDQEALPFATDLGNLWGVGKGDRGIVILAAISDRNLAIATGYQTEQYIPDLVTQQIQQEEIIPYFKTEQYGKGLIFGLDVIKSTVLEESIPDYVAEAQEESRIKLIWEYIAMALGLGMVVLSIVVSPKSKTIVTNAVIIIGSIIIGFIAYFVFLKGDKTIDFVRDAAVIISFIGITINTYLVLKKETEQVWPYALLVTFAIGTPISGLYLYGFTGIVFTYLAGAGFTFGIFLITYLITLMIKDPYQKYHTIKVFKLDVFSYIFPMPMFVVDMIVENLLDKWRNTIRFSKKTGLEMRKLSETEDDKYLKSGQVSEEKVKSVDYDVWITDEQDDILILSYTTWFSGYSSCSKCRFKTWYLVYDKTITAATYSSSGTGETKKACAHCGHQTITRYTIPRKERSSSSGSSGSSYSSGSSGGGGSWGGGSFGGGGSSSSW